MSTDRNNKPTNPPRTDEIPSYRSEPPATRASNKKIADKESGVLANLPDNYKIQVLSYHKDAHESRGIRWRLVYKAGVWFLIIAFVGTGITYREVQWKHPYVYVEIIRADGTTKAYRVVKPDPSRPLSSEETEYITMKLLRDGDKAVVSGRRVERAAAPTDPSAQTSEPVPTDERPSGYTADTQPEESADTPQEQQQRESTSTEQDEPEPSAEPANTVPDETGGNYAEELPEESADEYAHAVSELDVPTPLRELLARADVFHDAARLQQTPNIGTARLARATNRVTDILATDTSTSSALLHSGNALLQALALRAGTSGHRPTKAAAAEKHEHGFFGRIFNKIGFGARESGNNKKDTVPGRAWAEIDTVKKPTKLAHAGPTYAPDDQAEPPTRTGNEPLPAPTPAPKQREPRQEPEPETPAPAYTPKHTAADSEAETPSINAISTTDTPETPTGRTGTAKTTAGDTENTAPTPAYRTASIKPTDLADKISNPDVRRMLKLPEVRRDMARIAKNPNILLADLDPTTVALIGALIVDPGTINELIASRNPGFAGLARKAMEYANANG